MSVSKPAATARQRRVCSCLHDGRTDLVVALVQQVAHLHQRRVAAAPDRAVVLHAYDARQEQHPHRLSAWHCSAQA
jgi:hypothetical protein